MEPEKSGNLETKVTQSNSVLKLSVLFFSVNKLELNLGSKEESPGLLGDVLSGGCCRVKLESCVWVHSSHGAAKTGGNSERKQLKILA